MQSPRFSQMPVVALLAGLSSCFSAPANPAATAASASNHAGCEMTLQADSFAGMCAQLTLRNTGSYPMYGWTISFDLPGGGSLTNGYNAKFETTASGETITPLAGQEMIAPGATFSLGYCTSTEAKNLTLTAGLCDTGNVGDTAVVEPEPSVAVKFAAAQNGNAATCTYDAAQVAIAGGNLAVSAVGSACGLASSTQAYGGNTLLWNLRTAADAGVVTGLVWGDDAGQEIAVSIDAAARTLNMTITKDGRQQAPRVCPLAFDPSSDTHAYSLTHSDTAIILRIDGTNPCVVGAPDVEVPTFTQQFISVGVRPQEGATLPAAPATAQVSGVRVR